MYRGFNINLKLESDFYYNHGLKLYFRNQFVVRKNLKSYIIEQDILDGAKMQQEWFPQINSDIFISHSHRDEKLAITFAGWLNGKFGLKCFIDSCIWGYADELLKIIDDEYCTNGKGGYNYNKRNISTSHAHMMLSTALYDD